MVFMKNCDYLIITHLPTFYKVNLYNALSKKLNLHVVFIGSDTSEKRGSDFTLLNSIDFKHSFLSTNNFQNRSKINTLFILYKLICQLDYKKIIVCGWDLPEFWLSIIISRPSKNCIALESTALESPFSGIKGAFKKLFLTRVKAAFASGKLHADLLNKLDYVGDVFITNGVGIINYVDKVTPSIKTYSKKFLFIGRLAKEKNLDFLISIFNDIPECSLVIVGEGDESTALKEIANTNISFVGAVNNSDIQRVFSQTDYLILPSVSETWGLVVEESLYFGVPVILSKNCGSQDLVTDSLNGYLFDPYNRGQLSDIISNIDESVHHAMVSSIGKDFIQRKDKQQVEQYVQCLG